MTFFNEILQGLVLKHVYILLILNFPLNMHLKWKLQTCGCLPKFDPLETDKAIKKRLAYYRVHK